MSTEKTKELLLGLFLATIAVIVYANSLGNGFVGDDHSVILHNPVLRGNPLSLFSGIDTTSDTELLPFYRPFTYLTFLLEQRLHGLTPYLVRLCNVLLHAANTLLVYRLSRSLLPNKYTALLAGLLFAIHPLQSEGVNFNSGGRNTMLACFFVLAAYQFHQRSVMRDSLSTAFAGAALFLTGLLSKELALAVIPFIVTLEITCSRENRTGSRVHSYLRLAPYGAATLIYLFMRWLALSKYGIQTGMLPGMGAQAMENTYIIPGLVERLQDNLYIIPKYLQIIVWPAALSPRHLVPDNLAQLAIPLAAAWLGIIIGLGWLLTKGHSRATLFGLSWLAAFWLPVSGVIYFSNVSMAERFLYLPAIGLWIVVADQFSRLAPAEPKAQQRSVAVAAVLIILVLSPLTIRRTADWKSDLTLNTKLVAQYPENPHGHANLASAYLDRKGEHDLDLAEQEFTSALTLDPNMVSLHSPLGYIRLSKGDFAGALAHYSTALATVPKDRDARINSAIALEGLGKTAEAVEAYRYYLSMPGHNNIPGSQEYAAERLRILTDTKTGSSGK